MRRLIASMDQGILAVDHLDARIGLAQGCEIRIVLPETWTRGTNVGQELTRATPVEVADRRGKHYDVARRLMILQDQPSHFHPGDDGYC